MASDKKGGSEEGFNINLINGNINRTYGESCSLVFTHSVKKKGKVICSFTPSADMFELHGKVVIQVELAGVRKEDINIELHEGIIEVSGLRKRERLSEEENFQRMERSYGFFKRSFSLPKYIKKGDIEASFMDGVLEIIVPKNGNYALDHIKID